MNNAPSPQTPPPQRPRPHATGYLLALAAAVAYGTNAVLNRAGLAAYGSPLVAITIALAVGTGVMAPVAWRAWRRANARGDAPPDRRTLLFVMASGLSSLTGYGSNVLALSLLPVVVVTPISSAYPLVTVLLVRLLLAREEPVSRRAAVGAVCIVAGIALISIFRQ